MIREAKDIDAVAVFSGAPDHPKHMKMCMERGWHVVSAVPACMTLDEAAMMKETKERTGLKYMMHETSYYRQPTIFARNMFETGEFGELFYSEVEYYHDRDLKKCLTNKKNRAWGPDGKPSWRWGLPPMLYPTHSTGLLTGVTKERFKRVSCLGWGGTRDELKNHPIVADNVYDNPYWNMSALMQTDRGNMCRCNVFWLAAAHGERAQWFGDKATLYMPKHRVHEAALGTRTGETGNTQRVAIPEYWKTDMLPPAMRHNSGHDGSHTFLSAEFINALVQDREPAVDIYEALAMTVPGIIAIESAHKNGEQLEIPQFDRS
jgi:predicted dehydrogenase